MLCDRSKGLVVAGSGLRITVADISQCTLAGGSIIARVSFNQNVALATAQLIASALNDINGTKVTVSTTTLTIVAASTQTLVGGTAAPSFATPNPTASSASTAVSAGSDNDNLSTTSTSLIIVAALLVAALFVVTMWLLCRQRPFTSDSKLEERTVENVPPQEYEWNEIWVAKDNPQSVTDTHHQNPFYQKWQ